jgi:hypothetical protein
MVTACETPTVHYSSGRVSPGAAASGEFPLAYCDAVLDRSADRRTSPEWVASLVADGWFTREELAALAASDPRVLGRSDSIERFLLRTWLDERSL